MTQAGKVAEIFSTAGEAFTKLGLLAMGLQPSAERSNSSDKWGDSEIEMLKKAVSTFGNDIEKLSQHIKSKSTNQIKTALKQKAMNNLTVGASTKSTLVPNVTPIKANSSPLVVQRIIGQKSKPETPIMIAPLPTKKSKPDIPSNMNILTMANQQLRPVLVNTGTLKANNAGIPLVASSQGFQVILPKQPIKNTIPSTTTTYTTIPITMPLIHSAGVVQRVADAETSVNVDIES